MKNMKLFIGLLFVLFPAIHAIEAPSIADLVMEGNIKVDAKVLNTQGNKLGIGDDHCVAVSVSAGDQPSQIHIICSSGKILKDVSSRQGSLTGTPGNLAEGYIGTVRITNSTPGKMGSGSRIDYFVKKQNEEVKNQNKFEFPKNANELPSPSLPSK